ncbi:hypothetical protein FA15DRAFT_658085 [Coprinopsis marcescibilis]|uniref:Uncharacterized protein n=1 Tax=Coprinopsis marcescibilis TaxID=230819 RepID=A0A5C3KP65_COPMA|nr:hypothetical protein FA15DRAFT_658085 [Coprinopsis marcescibilis]
MIIAAFLMCIIASLDVALHLRHVLDIFVGLNNSNSKSVIAALNDTSSWINVMKMACYVAQTFVGDAILIHRCWIVHGRNGLVIILPILFWLGFTACGVMTLYIQATSDTMGALLKAKSIMPFITSMLVLTLAMNVLTTGLIVYSPWKIQKPWLNTRSTFTLRSPFSALLILSLESGLIYTVSMVILFAVYMVGNNAHYGVSNAIVQIIGITFNLMITSVGHGNHAEGGIAPPNSFMSPDTRNEDIKPPTLSTGWR